MVHVRTFLNSDVPDLVELWRRQPGLEGRIARISPAMLETHVFARSYFDPNGLIVAAQDDMLVGACLCGFAPVENGSGLDHRVGVVSLLLVDPAAPSDTLGHLWREAKSFFVQRKCESVYFGSRFPDSPFLFGFIGGTFVPGLADSDVKLSGQLNRLGFQAGGTVNVLRLDLQGFRLPVDRRVILAKRQYEVRLSLDPAPANWWMHHVLAFRHHLDFRILQRKTNQVCGRVSVCNTHPQDSGWDSRYFGIMRIDIDGSLQRSGLGQAILSDAIKDLEQRGVVQLEAQVPETNEACHAMLLKMGFRPWYAATQLRVPLAGE